MDEKTTNEIKEHTEKATEAFKTADELKKAQEEGLIEQQVAAQAITELNEEGLAEAEKVIELQNEAFTEKE